MIRLIQLKNNMIIDDTPITQDDGGYAEYCALGYFDGIDTKSLCDCKTWKQIWQTKQNLQLESSSLPYNVYNILCVGLPKLNDQEFWESKEPFLFISLIRLRGRYDDIRQKMEALICKYKEELSPGNIVCYRTVDSSDLVLCIKCNDYKVGAQILCSLRSSNNTSSIIKIQKTYSIFSFRQSYVDGFEDEKCLYDEDDKVDCRLCCLVKEYSKLEEFLEELETSLKTSPLKFQYILGSNDIVIELQEIQFKKLLLLYQKGALLTHDNKLYFQTFYNVVTEIKFKNERGIEEDEL